MITKEAIANATTTMLTRQKEAFEQAAVSLILKNLAKCLKKTNLDFDTDTSLPEKLLTFFWIYVTKYLVLKAYLFIRSRDSIMCPRIIWVLAYLLLFKIYKIPYIIALFMFYLYIYRMR